MKLSNMEGKMEEKKGSFFQFKYWMKMTC